MSVRIDIRPTLFIGLGGSGCRIAVELKARLEQSLGASSNYQRAVRFLCFDTANETFTAPQPNFPDRPVVRLVPEQELVRISNVPLHDLIRSREHNAAIADIYPEVLTSVQIDQGAQQIRRLGRIALFYHYDAVRLKTIETIRSLRQLEDTSELGVTADGTRRLTYADNGRLRVFIAASVCGGTGGGMFIDMAYLVRQFALSAGIGAAEDVDVVGLLLLPEAFPDIQTTGANRIRANAYASLLDMEYYNQATSAEDRLYSVRFPTERVEVGGKPFSLCYLINGQSASGVLQGVPEIAPALGEALQVLIASPIGERMDATLDNIRYSLTLHRDGYRTFYSAIGISQIVYPYHWLRRQFGQALQNRIIAGYFLRPVQRANLEEQARRWYTQNHRLAETLLSDGVRAALEGVTRNLEELAEDIGLPENAVSELQLAYKESKSRFEQQVKGRIAMNLPNAVQGLQASLQAEVRRLIDAWPDGGGVRWALDWLTRIAAFLRAEVNRTTSDNPDAVFNKELSEIFAAETTPIVGAMLRRRRVAQACRELISYFSTQAQQAEIYRARRELYIELQAYIERLRAQVLAMLNDWSGLLSDNQPLQLPVRSSIDVPLMKAVGQLEQTLRAAVDAVLLDPEEMVRRVQESLAHHGDLSAALVPNRRAGVQAALLQACEAFYQTEERDVYQHMSQLPAGQRGQLLEELDKLAQPLLRYSITGQSARIIRVLGANTAEQGNRLLELFTRKADLSAVPIHEPSKLAMLVTHHGLPVTALANFEEYAEKYRQMQQQPNPIFHMSNELEDRPHDPGSVYFVDLTTFNLIFARALAYEYILPLHSQRRNGQRPLTYFVLNRAFHQTLEEVVNRQVRELSNEIAALTRQLEERQRHREIESALYSSSLEDYEIAIARARIDTLTFNRNTLVLHLRRFPTLEKVADPALFGLSSHPDYAPVLLTTRIGRDADAMLRPAINLAAAHAALFESESGLLPHLFMQAFERHYEADAAAHRTTLERRVQAFLRARQYPDSAGWWSEPGTYSLRLETRLRDELTVFQRLMRRQRWQPRHYRADYYLDPQVIELVLDADGAEETP